MKLQELINNNPAVIIYFYNTNCSSCNVLKPKVKQMVNSLFPEIKYHEIMASGQPALTSEAGVFASPTIIAYFDGKETLRESRYISVDQFEEKIKRYYDMLF